MSDSDEVLQTLFNKYDADNSNYLDRAEVGKLSYDLGYHIDLQWEMPTVLAQLDLNKDGKVSFSEFKKWWESPNNFEIFEKQNIKLVQQLTTLFQHHDKDRSGAITVDEFEKFHKALTAKGMTKKSFDETLLEMDADKDKKVTLNELVKWYRKSGLTTV